MSEQQEGFPVHEFSEPELQLLSYTCNAIKKEMKLYCNRNNLENDILIHVYDKYTRVIYFDIETCEDDSLYVQWNEKRKCPEWAIFLDSLPSTDDEGEQSLYFGNTEEQVQYMFNQMDWD